MSAQSKGGKARAASMTPEERSAQGAMAAQARWANRTDGEMPLVTSRGLRERRAYGTGSAEYKKLVKKVERYLDAVDGLLLMIERGLVKPENAREALKIIQDASGL